VQVDSATVESSTRYSVTGLTQHQQLTAVMTTLLWRYCFYATGQVGQGWTVVGFGPSQAELWLRPGWHFLAMHISTK